MKTLPRVLIVVEGGVVQEIMSDVPIICILKDFDNLKEGDTFNKKGYILNPVTKQSFKACVDADVDGAGNYVY